MINPAEITDFKRTDAELEEFLLFCIAVAGKTAVVQAQKVDLFIYNLGLELWLASNEPLAKIREATPFQLLRATPETVVLETMKKVKIGQYTRLIHAFDLVTDLNLRTCTVEQLESIKGIGPKTARFFLVHSRPDQQYAILDVHILRYLNKEGIKAPKATPPAGKVYTALEKEFLLLAAKSGMTVADFDLSLWNAKGK